MNLVQNREQIYLALFALMQTSNLFKTCTRKLQHWQDTSIEDQPALYMELGGESTVIVRGQPPRHVLSANLWVYVNKQDDPNGCGPTLNPLLDAVDAMFVPNNSGDHTFTLGGLVHHCWIEGQTHVFEGNLGNEAVAIVPVKILVT